MILFKKIPLAAFVFINVIFMDRLPLQAQPNSLNHSYPYSSKNLWGLCTKDRKPLTLPLYNSIEQKGYFILAGKPGQDKKDIYSAIGKLILSSADSFFMLNDTAMLIISGKQHPESGDQSSTVYASGRIQYHQFTPDQRLSAAPLLSENIYTVHSGKKRGVYDLLHNKELLSVTYEEIRIFSGGNREFILLGWNNSRDYRLVSEDGNQYSVAPRIYDATNVFYKGKGYSIGQDIFTPEGKKLPAGHYMTDAEDVIRVQKLLKGKGKYGYRTNDAEGPVTLTCYLTNKDGKPLLNAKDNPDSMVRDIGYGLFAVEKRSDNVPVYGGQNTVVAIYDGIKKKVVARRSTDCWLTAANQIPFPNIPVIWSIQTLQKITYINTRGDTIASIKKEAPVMEKDIPHFNYVTGGLEYPDGKTIVFYQHGKSVWRFDELKALVSGRSRSDVYPPFYSGYYKGRIKDKWGLFYLATPKMSPRYALTDPGNIQIKAIAPIDFDDITVPEDKDCFVFKLQRGEKVCWVDTTGHILIGGTGVPYLDVSSSADDGTRLAFEYRVEGENNSYQRKYNYATRLMMIDTLGNMRYSYNVRSRDNLCRECFYLVNDREVFYTNGAYARLFNLKKGSFRTVLNGYRPTPLLIKGRAIGCEGSKDGKGLPLYLLSSNAKSDPFIEISSGKYRAIIFGHEDKAFLNLGNPFFPDCRILEGENHTFLGIVTESGAIYD